MTINEIVSVVLPVFGLIVVGLVSERVGLVREHVTRGLGDFVYVLAVPMLLFRTVATAHFPDVSPWPLWVSYFGGAIVSWSIGSMVATQLFHRARAEGVIAGVSASFSNLVMVAIPLVLTAFGEAGAVPLLTILSVHLPTMMVVGTLMTERALRADQGGQALMKFGSTLRALGLNLVTNPYVIALLAGALYRQTGLALNGPTRVMIDQIAAAAIPCSLLSLGVGLSQYGISGNFRLGLVLSGLKVIVMPSVVFTLSYYVFAMPPLWISVATVSAACSSGINAYLFAVRFGVAHGTATNTIALSTALAAPALVFWLDFVARYSGG